MRQIFICSKTLWISYNLDLEHRFEDNFPLYMQVSKGDCIIHLSEHHGDASPGSTIRVEVDDLKGYQKLLAEKKYMNARPGIDEVSWGQEMPIVDPFGNKVVFTKRKNA